MREGIRRCEGSWSSGFFVFTKFGSLLNLWFFLGCLVSFVLKILYLFLYAIFKVQCIVIFITSTDLISHRINQNFFDSSNHWLTQYNLYNEMLSHFRSFLIWQPPTFPCRLQHSIIGRLSLNRRVRDENGCYPKTHRHQKSLLVTFVTSATLSSVHLFLDN